MSGDGLVKATPDQAWVMLATESRSKNPKDAQSQNANTMSAVQQKLVAAGIPKDAIRTLSYDLQLESDWVNGRMVPRGYVARNLVEVRLDDISRVGEVIDVAVTSGVNSVQGVRFDLKNRAGLEREALKRATADARMRAEAAAAGAGRTHRSCDPHRRARHPSLSDAAGNDDATVDGGRQADGDNADRRRGNRDPVECRHHGDAQVSGGHSTIDRLRHRYHAATDR